MRFSTTTTILAQMWITYIRLYCCSSFPQIRTLAAESYLIRYLMDTTCTPAEYNAFRYNIPVLLGSSICIISFKNWLILMLQSVVVVHWLALHCKVSMLFCPSLFCQCLIATRGQKSFSVVHITIKTHIAAICLQLSTHSQLPQLSSSTVMYLIVTTNTSPSS